MWIVEIELRTLKNELIRRVQVSERNTYTSILDRIGDGTAEKTERWVVLYSGNFYVAEFKVE